MFSLAAPQPREMIAAAPQQVSTAALLRTNCTLQSLLYTSRPFSCQNTYSFIQSKLYLEHFLLIAFLLRRIPKSGLFYLNYIIVACQKVQYIKIYTFSPMPCLQQPSIIKIRLHSSIFMNEPVKFSCQFVNYRTNLFWICNSSSQLVNPPKH